MARINSGLACRNPQCDKIQEIVLLVFDRVSRAVGIGVVSEKRGMVLKASSKSSNLLTGHDLTETPVMIW